MHRAGDSAPGRWTHLALSRVISFNCFCYQLSEGRESTCGGVEVFCTEDPCDDLFCKAEHGEFSACIQATGGAEQYRCDSGTACTTAC